MVLPAPCSPPPPLPPLSPSLSLVPSGGTPPLRATSSATVFVNLLDLNDNDPTFQNLPFVAEVVEGTPAGVSIFQVGFHFLAVPALCHLPHLIPTSQQGGSGCCCARLHGGHLEGAGQDTVDPGLEIQCSER